MKVCGNGNKFYLETFFALGIAAESPQCDRFFSGARGLAAESPTLWVTPK